MKQIQTILLILFLATSCNQPDRDFHSKAMDEADSLRFQIGLLQQEIKELKSETGKTSENENFQDFLFKFMTDSIFQVKRTEFPLTYIHWKDDYPGNQVDTARLTKENWNHQWLYFNEYSSVPQIYDNFEMELRPTDKRLLHFTGVETGMNAKYFFETTENKWYLTKMENLGD
jgi:hypothetical protein